MLGNKDGFYQLIFTCPTSSDMDKFRIEKHIATFEIYLSASLQRIEAMPNSASHLWNTSFVDVVVIQSHVKTFGSFQLNFGGNLNK